MKLSKMSSTQKKELKYGLLFLSPWLIGYLVFMIYPIFFSLFMSFTKVVTSGTGFQFEFIGFENYLHTLTINLNFVLKLLAYLQTLVVQVPLIVIMSLVLAMLLNQPVKLRSAYRTLYFLPVIIMSGPVVTILEKYSVFASFNMDNIAIIQWLESANLGMISSLTITLVSSISLILWYSGVQILIFLSALQKSQKDIHEAALIDGASGWQIFWKITLPGLKDVILINFIYTIVLLTTLVDNPVTNMIKENMFDKAYGFGYASAQGWVYAVCILVMLGIYYTIIKLMERRND